MTKELGQITFNYFQKDNLDSFFKLVPTASEVAEFLKTIGLDSSWSQFKEFDKRYTQIIENFKERCHELRADTSHLNFSWAKAKLDSIEISEKTWPLDRGNPKSKTVVLTIVDICFNSSTAKLKMRIKDANKYNDTWKPGGRIEISRL